MRKTLLVAAFVIFVSGVLLYGGPAFAGTVQVGLPDFDVYINNMRIDNAARQYPLIVYKDITYFPMTYRDCRFLGLESAYDPMGGLDIRKTGIGGSYFIYKATEKNPRRASARVAAFPIRVNGKAIDNGSEKYPLLLYKDITYFPLTWRFSAGEFGWEYNFYDGYGLVINSTPPAPPTPGEMAGIIAEAEGLLRDGPIWLSATLRAFSRHSNRVYGLINEHRSGSGGVTKWYRTVEATMADYSDNTAKPMVTGHLFVDADGALYASKDGKKWAAKGEGDVPEVAAFKSIASQDFSDMFDAYERLRQLPHDALGRAAYVDYYDGYLSLVISFMDEEPAYMPEALDPPNYGISAGGIKRHTFYFDIPRRCLRSYFLSTVPFYLGVDGEILAFAPSTTFYNVIDFDYEPFEMPRP